jgi:hypothetical protein
MTGLVVTTILGCSTPSGVCESEDGIDGQWTYEATQETPVPASIHGTMVITSGLCSDFQGSLDAVEVLATGESRRVSGFVSGTMLDSSLFRFEAVIAGDAREHLARIRSDSIAGDWVQSASGVARSGRFGGKRMAGS